MVDETIIENCSNVKTIEITLGQTEKQNIAIPDGKTILKPLQKVSIPKSFDCGCAKMFVWDKGDSKDMIWCGVVPLCGTTPIKVNPDLKKVSVLDGDIPQCGEAVKEDFVGKEKATETNESGFSWGWILLLVILLLFYIYKRR